MGSPPSSKKPTWQRAIAIFGGIAIAPIFGLAIGIFLLSATPVLLLLPLFTFPREPGAPPAPPQAFRPAHHPV